MIVRPARWLAPHQSAGSVGVPASALPMPIREECRRLVSVCPAAAWTGWPFSRGQ